MAAAIPRHDRTIDAPSCRWEACGHRSPAWAKKLRDKNSRRASNTHSPSPCIPWKQTRRPLSHCAPPRASIPSPMSPGRKASSAGPLRAHQGRWYKWFASAGSPIGRRRTIPCPDKARPPLGLRLHQFFRSRSRRPAPARATPEPLKVQEVLPKPAPISPMRVDSDSRWNPWFFLPPRRLPISPYFVKSWRISQDYAEPCIF